MTDLLEALKQSVSAPPTGAQPSFDEATEAWLASQPAEAQGILRQQIAAAQAAQQQTPATAPVQEPEPQPAPAAPAVQPTPEPATQPSAPEPAPSRGRGRPTKSSAAKLLEACAAGGLPPALAREYLALAAEIGT